MLHHIKVKYNNFKKLWTISIPNFEVYHSTGKLNIIWIRLIFPWSTHRQGRKAGPDLVQLRNDVVKIDEFKGDRTDSLYGLAAPVTIQRV